jgi:hypothetical protein
MSNQSPQPRPRLAINASTAYVDLHRSLESASVDLRKVDALWRRAEEAQAVEAEALSGGTKLRAELQAAQRELSAAQAAYSWYARATISAGTPPPEVRTIAAPLDESLKKAERAVSAIRRRMEAAAPPHYNQANPHPSTRLVQEAHDALVQAAVDRAKQLAGQVRGIISEDRDLYALNPARLPDTVSAAVREVAELDYLAGRLNAPGVVDRAFAAGLGDCTEIVRGTTAPKSGRAQQR